MIDPVTITHPRLPEGLDGLTIAHLSDLHIRKDRARYRKLISDVNLRGPDLVLLTGDYMTDAGDEPISHEVMTRLCEGLKPRIGSFFSFGNHDTDALRQTAHQWQATLLSDQRVRVQAGPNKPAIEIWGLNDTYKAFTDVSALLQSPVVHHGALSSAEDVERAGAAGPSDDLVEEQGRDGGQPFRIVLAHNPQILPTVADLKGDLMLSGHTHGGQIRPLPHLILHNSCDLPLRLSSGLLRHQSTLCAISRGVGEVLLPLRWLCPPHVPLYTLRRGAMLGQHGSGVQRLMRW